MIKPVKTLSPAQLRVEAAQRLWRVLDSGSSESLDAVLQPALESREQQAWMSAALYGCLRFYPRYQHQLYGFLSKPIKPREGVVQALLVLGMHQLCAMQVKAHAAINETVNACKALRKDWAVKLVNGILRNYQRQLSGSEFRNEIEEFAHSKWMIKVLKADWPTQWRSILKANNQQAPMCLRANVSQTTRARAIETLTTAQIPCQAHSVTDSGIILDKATDVSAIPGFSSGLFSVQDAAAQHAGRLLITESDQDKTLNVLDACAAPGGKTGHLLELLSTDSRLVALDVSASRLKLVGETFDRLGFGARENIYLQAADAADIKAWHKGELFDRILLDAPCTASGVIRRHPDIKIRRSLQQLKEVVQTQANILSSLWSVLKPGGKLLYATCSVFRAENTSQIQSFVAAQADAKVIPLSISDALNTEYGSQIFPGVQEQDGFFYALLVKNNV